jgi:hypothetical protein
MGRVVITGSEYLLRGQTVTAVAQWRQPKRTDPSAPVLPLVRTAAHTPRNVMVEYPDGRRVIRPFRGLRRPAANATEQGERGVGFTNRRNNEAIPGANVAVDDNQRRWS